MKARYGYGTVDVWKISLDETPDDFVKEALDKGILHWRERAGIKSMSMMQLYIGLSIGFPGDYVVFDGENYRFIKEKEYKKHYEPLAGENK